jgi:5-carboxymethyl-2-hydroxymuconate isomerase
MPHIQIDYSPNIEDVVDVAALCEAIREAATGIESFPLPGIRVRAIRVDHVAMADGDPKHGFIDMSIRLRAGRSDAVKRDAVDRLFAVLTEFMAPAMATGSIALSAEIRDIDAGLSPKAGTIRDHLKGAE